MPSPEETPPPDPSSHEAVRYYDATPSPVKIHVSPEAGVALGALATGVISNGIIIRTQFRDAFAAHTARTSEIDGLRYAAEQSNLSAAQLEKIAKPHRPTDIIATLRGQAASHETQAAVIKKQDSAAFGDADKIATLESLAIGLVILGGCLTPRVICSWRRARKELEKDPA
jgi:hypothetical protein